MVDVVVIVVVGEGGLVGVLRDENVIVNALHTLSLNVVVVSNLSVLLAKQQQQQQLL